MPLFGHLLNRISNKKVLTNALGGKFPFRATVLGWYSSTKDIMPSQYAVSDDELVSSDLPSDEERSEFEENLESIINKPVAKKKALGGGVAKKRRLSIGKDDRPVEEIYQKKTQLEHILLRPDTYIGSIERQEFNQWCYDKSVGRMIQRNLSFVPGLFKIFDEILVNAADNKIRDASMDTVKVDIERESGRISIYNNGRGIPIEMHNKEGMYVPELIFGHLLTSSNYDDKQKKVTGGRNGYGAKLCNIFSTEFTIETADSKKKKKYKQTFSKNMSIRGEPIITDYTKEDYTKITFKPDLNKFGMTVLDDDIIALFERRVYDTAGCSKNVKVYLNGERISMKSFKDYVELFMPKANPIGIGSADGAGVGLGSSLSSSNSSNSIIHEKFGDRWEVCVTTSDGSFQQMSFVNAICTYKGGTHVNYVSDQITTAIGETLKKKSKDMNSIKPAQIKNHLMVFINCLVENPTFDSQTKEYMTLRSSAFGSECKLGAEFIKKILKCGIVESVMSWARFKQNQQLKKTDGTKRNRLSGIAKLDDANNAGTKNAAKCTLIITEGDSAKALAVSGLSVVGRDNYGVFPLRGKLLNVREATHKQILENVEINSVKQILGLQHGQTYANVSSLRYGSLMIMTDQDHDGSHIKGLVINFLDHFFPSLLKIPGFLVEFITPIVKITKGREEIAFYTLPEYEAWKMANNEGRGWNIKYYKGLGTSTAADARKYFAAMERHRKVFAPIDDTDRQLVDMAFSKKRADERKEWLKTCTSDTFMDHSADSIKVSDFINKELILFSMADNARSIPSMIDGLKPGHRKILFSCFKRKLRGEIKVAQLAGYVSEHSAYHHGEQSLCSTIIGMAQNFVGSNNLNLLEPIGQFGTRLQGGKDAASPRYVFTSLSPFARLLFKAEDDALLKYLNDDGQSIEPSWYMPILPMVLVNGGEGIGTGWMTAIPNFNPRDIVKNLLALMENDEITSMQPWYHGFQGTVEPQGTDRYKVTGIWRKIDDSTLEITELPIGSWTQNYKEMLEQMISASGTESMIKDYKEYHTDTTVRFVINLTAEGMLAAEAEGIEKKFKLSTTVNLNNLVCFDQQGRLRRYPNPQSILEEFYHLRLEYYGKRKEWLANQLSQEWNKLDNKMRFIEEIIAGKLVVQNRKKVDIIADLVKRGYHPFTGKAADDNSSSSTVVGDDDESTALASGNTKNSSNDGYEYLLTLPIYSLTKERVEKLLADRESKEKELNELLAKKPKDLWRTDLDQFLAQWDIFERELAKIHNVERGKANTLGGKAKPKGATALKNKKKQLAVSDSEADDDESESESESEEDDDDTYGGKEEKYNNNNNNNNEKTTSTTKRKATAVKRVPKTAIKAVPASKNTITKSFTPQAPLKTTTTVAATKEPVKTLTQDEINSLPLSERINYMLSCQAKGTSLLAREPSPIVEIATTTITSLLASKRQSTLDSHIKKPSNPIVQLDNNIDKDSKITTTTTTTTTDLDNTELPRMPTFKRRNIILDDEEDN